jgi:hypothetical protein
MRVWSKERRPPYTGSSDGTYDIMVLGFESADHPVDAWMKRALEICGFSDRLHFTTAFDS